MKKVLPLFLLLFTICNVNAQLLISRETLKRAAANISTVPQSTHKFYRMIYIIEAKEMAAGGISANHILKSIGFKYENLNNPATGSFKVYLQNTTNTTIADPSWSTMTLAMTKVFESNATTLGASSDIKLPFNGSSFIYTGENVYVALEFVNDGTAIAGGSSGAVANAYSASKAKSATHASSATPIDALVDVAANYRPATTFQYEGTAIRDVLYGFQNINTGIAPQTKNQNTRASYFISKAELEAASIVNGDLLSSIGYNYSTPPTTTTTTGTMKVYLQNTTDNAYAKGQVWSGILTGMTEVRNGAATITNSRTVDFIFNQNFTYTGNGLYVVFEYNLPAANVETTANIAYGNNLLPSSSYKSLSNSFTDNLTSDNSRPYTRLGATANVLPVDLISFSAKADNSNVKISWSTASEKKNDRFELLHSTDGVLFNLLATQKGKGSFDGLSNYIVYDNQPANGVNYYKLLQYDLDDKSREVGMKTVNFSISSDLTTYFYPNPTTGILNVKTASKTSKKITITLIDLLGRTLYTNSSSTSSYEGLHSFNLPKWIKPGQYFLKMLDEKMQLKVEKLLIK